MKRTFIAFAIAALAGVLPASATVYSVDFSGLVSQTQGATGYSAGNTVTGHFDLNDANGTFLDFTIAGKSVASGYLSSAVIGPALTDAIYIAQVSPVALGTPSNSSFALDLSSLSNWPASATPYSLLVDKTQLSTNLDTVSNPASLFPSSFNYYTASANGTNIVSLSANVTTISASVATPEPASIALLASALLVLGVTYRLRRA